MLNKFKNLLSSKSLKNIGKLLTGTILGQILSIVLVPIATRIYGADAYGELAVFTSISSVGLSFLGFGLNSAIMVADTDEEARGIYLISVYSTNIIACFIALILVGISPSVRLFQTTLNYQFSCLMVAFMIATSNMINMSYSWLNRLGKYNVLLSNPIITPLVNNTILLLLGVTGYKDIGLLAGTIGAQIATLIHMKRNIGKMRYKLTLNSIKYLLKKNSDFILFQYPSGITNGIASQLPIILLSRFFGNSIVGYYSMTQKLLNIPISLIGGTVGRVFFKNISDIRRSNGDVQRYTFNVIKNIMIPYSFLTTLVFIFGDMAIPYILGEAWLKTGEYIRIMMLWNMFFLIVNSTAGFPSVIGMQKENMVNGILTLIIDFVTLFVTSIIFQNPLVTLLFFVIAHVIVHLLFFNRMLRGGNDFSINYITFSSKIMLIMGITFVFIRLFLIKLGYTNSI